MKNSSEERIHDDESAQNDESHHGDVELYAAHKSGHTAKKASTSSKSSAAGGSQATDRRMMLRNRNVVSYNEDDNIDKSDVKTGENMESRKRKHSQ